MVGLDAILRNTWDIANSMENLDKDRLHAISVGMQGHAMKIDLPTNATFNLRWIYTMRKTKTYDTY